VLNLVKLTAILEATSVFCFSNLQNKQITRRTRTLIPWFLFFNEKITKKVIF